jgi:hypothetical protein
MKMHRDALPDRLNTGGIRFQSQDWGALNVSHIHLPAGADAKPLLEGMPDNLCPVPHWGMVLEGSIKVEYSDGSAETVNEGEVYYWPPGHTISVDQEYRSIEFSPRDGMGKLLDHLRSKLGV